MTVNGVRNFQSGEIKYGRHNIMPPDRNANALTVRNIRSHDQKWNMDRALIRPIFLH